MSRRVSIGLAVVGAVAVVGTALWWARPAWAFPRDRAEGDITATLRIAMYRPKLMFETKERETAFGTFQQTQAALLKSNLVLDRALADPNVERMKLVQQQPEPTEWLRRNLKVEFSPESEVFEVSLGAVGAPEERANLLGAIIDAYIKHVVNREAEDRLRRLQFLEKTMRDYEDELKTKRANLREMAQQAGAVDKGRMGPRRRELIDEALSLREEAALDLRLKQAEVEAMLESRKGREEAAALEDGLAAIKAQRKAIDEDRKALMEERESMAGIAIDLDTIRGRIGVAEETAREIGREIERLKVELQAPSRVDVIDRPKTPRTRGGGR